MSSRSEDREGPTRHSIPARRLQGTPERLSIPAPFDGVLIEVKCPHDLAGLIVEEFDAEVPRLARDDPGQMLRGGLGSRVEQGVAAADVRLERVILADAIAELDVVRVAGTAAVGRIG